jgi:hypothetical protein
MAKLFNRAKVTTATAGTGTVTLGAASSAAFFTFAEAGVANSDVVTYVIEDGTNVEIGRGTYTSAGTTLSRDTVLISKISGVAGTTKLTLSGSAVVYIDAAAEDIPTAPASSTDNAAARFDGTTARSLQNSALLIADTTGALSRSGGGGIPAQGTNTNDSAAAGDIGELISSGIAVGSATSLVTATPKTVTSISLTAGDWDVWGAVGINPGVGANVTRIIGSISLVDNTADINIDANGARYSDYQLPFATASANLVAVAAVRKSLAATTTIYLIINTVFTGGTNAGFGYIGARRCR